MRKLTPFWMLIVCMILACFIPIGESSTTQCAFGQKAQFAIDPQTQCETSI